jgi:hypothetical protein
MPSTDLFQNVKATPHIISKSRQDLQLRYVVYKLSLTHVSYPFANS